MDADTIDSFIERQSRGAPIPGASLTRGVDESYPWERPPQFASAVDALNDIESLDDIGLEEVDTSAPVNDEVVKLNNNEFSFFS